MTSKKRRVVPEPLKDVRFRVDDWRRNRKGQCRMPRELWEAAVKVAKRYGVSFVSGTLSLGYVSLKQKVNGNWGPVKKRTESASFVEIATPPISMSSLMSSNEIELFRPDGHRIVIRNADSECVSRVTKAFLSK